MDPVLDGWWSFQFVNVDRRSTGPASTTYYGRFSEAVALFLPTGGLKGDAIAVAQLSQSSDGIVPVVQC